ncbi:MAG: bifunctional demethylmenaquinone methyltransferase/2-methoxy-6-polyprenyl-1,4-benzoquinol methylase UbiE [Bacteroidota bacterium]|nr:bifunctional demethylmenaquinone methyltransferase/2-methoxy-6-polyprenyl-1,4-benzoquinol methylase UbiE [Bacteroidota bacterium]
MSKNVTPYNDQNTGKKEQVEQMFDNISQEYDNLNKVISLGSDIKWKKKVVALVEKNHPQRILDVATGTADLAIMLGENIKANIVGVDISEGMLNVGRRKIAAKSFSDRIQLLNADSEKLPFENDSFDAITVAYGIRNFENLEVGLAEMLRVLKPKGKLVILETSVPEQFPFRQGYMCYTKYVLPTIGKFFSKDKKAYKYLSESASKFPYGERLNNILRKIGFINVVNKPQMFGSTTIYVAYK